MSIFSGKTRAYAGLVLLVALVCSLGVTIGGCSDSNDGPEKSKLATLVIKHDLVAERSLSSLIKSIIVSGYNSSGRKSFSPETFGRVNIITKQVPVDTTSIRIVYLDVNGDPVGIYAQGVKLAAGQECLVEDPAWQDVESQTFLTGLTISPDTKTIGVGDVVQFAVSGQFTAEGGSFAQDMTDNVSWKIGSSSAILQDLGDGAFKGFLAGTETVTACFGAIEVAAKVEVVGATVRLEMVGENIEPIEGVYYLPLAYDDKDNVLPEHSTGLNFMCPSFVANINVPDEELSKHVTVTVGDEEIVEYSDGCSEDQIFVKLHPKKVGKTDVVVTYAQPVEGGNPIVHTGKVSVEVVDAPLVGFEWSAPEIIDVTGNQYEIPLGAIYWVTIKALFSNGDIEDAEAVRYKASAVSAMWSDGAWTLDKSFPITMTPDGGYVLQDGTRVPSMFEAVCDPEANLGDKATLTMVTPDGYQFVSGTAYVGPAIDLTFTVGDPVPQDIILYKFDELVIDGYPAVQMHVGDEMVTAALLRYSDHSEEDITDEVEIIYNNPDVLEFSERLKFKALRLGRAFITVHDPVGRDRDRDYMVEVIEE